MTENKIKALSIKQPWAWAIVNGYKTIENRTWKTKFRGAFLIHASKQFDKKGYEWIKENASKLVLTSCLNLMNSLKAE